MAIRALIAFLPCEAAGNALRSAADARLLLFALLANVAAGVLSGFAPAVHVGRKSLMASMRERGGAGAGGGEPIDPAD